MLAALALEWIGHDMDRLAVQLGEKALRRPWVAEITGIDGHRLSRRFIDGRIDYVNANSPGSRGVMLHYLLESDHLYEVSAWTAWKSPERYFCWATESGDIRRCTEQEAREWAKAL